MSKAKLYFIDFCWKIEFDAEKGEWISQELSVQMMTLSLGRIDMWLTPDILFRG